MIGLSEHKFRSVTEFTNEITSTIFAEEADQKASSIFEYTNEEIIRLGLDIDTDKSLYLTKEEPPSEQSAFYTPTSSCGQKNINDNHSLPAPINVPDNSVEVANEVAVAPRLKDSDRKFLLKYIPKLTIVQQKLIAEIVQEAQ